MLYSHMLIMYCKPGPNGRPDVDATKMNAAAAAEFDANAQVADDEFPSMEEAVMLSRGIRTSINKSSQSTGSSNVFVWFMCKFVTISVIIWFTPNSFSLM